jgi:hypothetical protein
MNFGNHPSHLSAPLDQHHVAWIEVPIIFTERLVSTWYAAIKYYVANKVNDTCVIL